ncbi:hypothetical protein INR76_06370 [Marixanthomonas sp. SCSIO 43207]|uniref:hypothetical protein n=1 Tax=Marixanthomonas sp. SCSIO 43207 TaxID=2779360 RepID=UPI001CA887BF|nr:hypothetical protein [Marixanthomonas sp. SCSIO 43207]UAB82380.1 hypothetical protein INR76_06370 [Marixanthomonas sp. SCSIO 43207]
MDIVHEALQFEEETTSFKSTNDRIVASKKAKKLILALNERYKKTKDAKLMDIMKRLTAIKRKAEKRIKAKIVV